MLFCKNRKRNCTFCSRLLRNVQKKRNTSLASWHSFSTKRTHISPLFEVVADKLGNQLQRLLAMLDKLYLNKLIPTLMCWDKFRRFCFRNILILGNVRRTSLTGSHRSWPCNSWNLSALRGKNPTYGAEISPRCLNLKFVVYLDCLVLVPAAKPS